MCFQNDGKTAQAAKCVKSSITAKVIDSILSIDTFVLLKGMLQLPHCKYHVKTISIDQSSSNNAIFEQKCLQNIKKLYKHAGKYDNQQQLKDIIDTSMVSSLE